MIKINSRRATINPYWFGFASLVMPTVFDNDSASITQAAALDDHSPGDELLAVSRGYHASTIRAVFAASAR